MYALSVRQPWASLIASGRKTIEVRTWTTSYRGPLVIVSAKAADGALVERYGDGPRGVTLALVDLVSIGSWTMADARRSIFIPPGVAYAWKLDNVRSVAPHAVRGRLGLLPVSPELADVLADVQPASSATS